MKLITYLDLGASRVGCEENGAVVPLHSAGFNFPDVLSVVLAGPERLDEIRRAVADYSGETKALDALTVLAPFSELRREVICLGLNYSEHAVESMRYKKEAYSHELESAVYFSKRVDAPTAWNGDIPACEGLTERLDYEAELAVIISRDCKNVPFEEAKNVVFGYTVVNDVSARDVQQAHKQWYLGKSIDGFLPMGPRVVTADEFDFPPALKIESRVNGEVRQSSNTARMTHGIAEVICELSKHMTLRAGDVIAMGTPGGVGMGFTPPRFLKKGDTVECSVEGIGSLVNRVV